MHSQQTDAPYSNLSYPSKSFVLINTVLNIKELCAPPNSCVKSVRSREEDRVNSQKYMRYCSLCVRVLSTVYPDCAEHVDFFDTEDLRAHGTTNGKMLSAGDGALRQFFTYR